MLVGEKMIIDAKYMRIGRLASFVAKKLLSNIKIEIVNAEKAIITGNPNSVYKIYLQKRQVGDALHGPFFPRRPDLILRRTVRGMLPKNKRGRAALKNLKVHIGIPEGIKNIETLKKDEINTDFITLENLCKKLGWSG